MGSGVLWHTLAYSGILWHTLAYSGILRYTLASSCILWHTLAYSGILWHTLAYFCILWDTESRKPRQRVSNADRKVFANTESFCDKFIIGCRISGYFAIQNIQIICKVSG